MKNLFLLFVSVCFLVFSSCNTLNTEDDLQDEVVLKSGSKVMNFRAHLSGDQEVPANESMAQGQAIFQLSKDGMKLSYKLIVANIDDVRMSHIHIAPAGSNGSVSVWLYPPAAPPVLLPGTTNGILAEGIIMAENVGGPLKDEDEPLSALIKAMKDGNAYVNVHTVMYGGGEIRGQIIGK